MYVTAKSSWRSHLGVYENGVLLPYVVEANVGSDGVGFVIEAPAKRLPYDRVPLEDQVTRRAGRFEVRHRKCGSPVKEVVLFSTSVLVCTGCGLEFA